MATLILLGGCGHAVDSGDGDGEDRGDQGDGEEDDGFAGDAPQVEPDPFEPAPPPRPLSDDVIAEAADLILEIASSAAFTHSILVENATTGQLIVESNADALLKPASNTKLYTTAAAMEILGEDHAIATRVFASAPPGADGVVAGDLVILLEHDFTLSSDLYDDGPRQPLDRIARALADRGVVEVSGDVRVLGESVFEGNSVGSLDLAAQRTQTTEAVAEALAAAGIRAGAVESDAALEPPAGSVLLVEHAAVSLGVATSPLNSDSNNEFADLLIRHLGWLVEGESSAAAGSAAILDWLRSIGVTTDGIEVHDGSGLSHDNRVSARSTVALLGFMDGSPVGAAWGRTLAIAGVRGTLGGRLTGDDTAGRVFGKTGTLRDTITLSGYLENRHDGQRYRFSILWNAVSNQATARALADDIVEAVAGDLQGDGAPPPAPELLYVRSGGAPGLLDIGWTEVEEADGYLVWLSEDGRTWPRGAARFVRGQRFAAGALSPERTTYVRVSARAAGGLESDPSHVYGATASGGPAGVLLVDGNDVWRDEPAPENVLGRGHDFLAGLAAAAGSVAVASANHRALERGIIELADHDVVVWAAGEESTMTGALSAAERELLAAHLAGGGALLLSGAEVVWALADQGADDEQAFVADVLGTVYVEDDALTYEFEGAPDASDGFADVGLASFLAPDGMDIRFPDVLAPGDGAIELLRYVGGTGGVAAIGYPAVSGRRLVVTGFPIEAVPSAAVRARLMEAALSFLE